MSLEFIKYPLRTAPLGAQYSLHMLRGYSQTSDNSSEGVGNLCKWQIFVRRLPIPSDHLSEDIDKPIDQFAKVLDYLQRHLL
jgi:hypothetical protein